MTKRGYRKSNKIPLYWFDFISKKERKRKTNKIVRREGKRGIQND